MPCDPRGELVARLAAALVRAKKAQRRKDKAHRRFVAEMEAAQEQFQQAVAAAARRYQQRLGAD